MQRVLKFIGGGVAATVVDYVVYTLFVMVIFGGDVGMAWLASIFSGIAATFAAFILHSKITWKERNPGKYGIIKFFAWNAFVIILVRPLLTKLFGLLTGLYQFAFMISEVIHLPFDYDFVESTGIYVLMTIVTMTLNYIFYEKVVFGDVAKVEEEKREEIDVKSVRKTGKEAKSQKKTKHSTDK